MIYWRQGQSLRLWPVKGASRRLYRKMTIWGIRKWALRKISALKRLSGKVRLKVPSGLRYLIGQGSGWVSSNSHRQDLRNCKTATSPSSKGRLSKKAWNPAVTEAEDKSKSHNKSSNRSKPQHNKLCRTLNQATTTNCNLSKSNATFYATSSSNTPKAITKSIFDLRIITTPWSNLIKLINLMIFIFLSLRFIVRKLRLKRIRLNHNV